MKKTMKVGVMAGATRMSPEKMEEFLAKCRETANANKALSVNKNLGAEELVANPKGVENV